MAPVVSSWWRGELGEGEGVSAVTIALDCQPQECDRVDYGSCDKLLGEGGRGEGEGGKVFLL